MVELFVSRHSLSRTLSPLFFFFLFVPRSLVNDYDAPLDLVRVYTSIVENPPPVCWRPPSTVVPEKIIKARDQ